MLNGYIIPTYRIKFRFYPNAEQEKVILQTMGNSRFVYNYFLQKQQQLYTQYKEQLQLFKNNQITEEPQSTFLTAIDMVNQLPQLKKDVFSIPRDNFKFINFASNLSNETDLSINANQFNSLKNYWLNQGLSTSLQQAIRHLHNSYQRFFKKQSSFPQFKKKSNRNSFTITINNISWRDNTNDKSPFKNKCIVLNKTKTPLNIRYDREFNHEHVSSITISREPSGKYYISLLIKHKDKNITVEQGTNPSNKIVGIDVGIRTTVTMYDKNDNNFITKSLEKVSKYEKRMKRLCRGLSRKQKNSKSRNRQRINLAQFHEKIANYRTDFYHKLSTNLVKNYDTIVIENLAIKNMVRNHKLAKSIQQQSWRQLFDMLEYKCKWYGKTLIKANRYYASSKICSCCNQLNQEADNNQILPGQKKKKCIAIALMITCVHCGETYNRDENAAKNLANYNLDKYIPVSDGKSTALKYEDNKTL